MGIQDRDYYREWRREQDRSLSFPPSRSRSRIADLVSDGWYLLLYSLALYGAYALSRDYGHYIARVVTRLFIQ